MSGHQQVAPKACCDQVPQLRINIADDVASTVIHLRGPGSCAGMSDLGCMFEKLGVQLVSCSTLPSAGSCDMTLVVVDRHDSQPLDDCLKQSVRQGLHSVLQNCDSSFGAGKSRPSESIPTAPTMQVQQQQQQQEQQQQFHLTEPGSSQLHSRTDSQRPVDLCGTTSVSEMIQHSATCSRQPSFSETLQDKQLMLEQHEQEQEEQAGHSDRNDCHLQNGNRSNTRFNLPLCPLMEDAASPILHSNSLRPILKIDIPPTTGTGLHSSSSLCHSSGSRTSNQSSVQTTPAEFAGFEPVRSVMSLSISSRGAGGGRQQQQQHGLQAEDLAERLMQLGMQRSRSKQLADDSSSEDERDVAGTSSARCSTIRSSQDFQQQGLLSRERAVNSTSAMRLRDAASSGRGWCKGSPVVCCSNGSSSSSRRTISAAEQQAAAAAPYSMSWQPEHSVNSASSLGRLPAGSVPASPFDGEKSRAVALLSPFVGIPPASARRCPPHRTPSRIILSPVAPDGTLDPEAQPKLFISIPKQCLDDKRTRRQGSRSQSSKAMATTPSSSSARQMLQQLAGQDSFDKLTSTVTSPTAAAAEAASKMSFNVAAAAAQLLGKNRDAAAAAIASAVAGDSSSLMCSPEQTTPSSATNSSELLLSPVAATPRGVRGVPPTPATPVHPVVAAVAAVAFKAAAEAVGEAAESVGLTGTIEEGEEGCDLVESQDDGADSRSDSGSEEWWCGSLTGMVVRDIMTGPLKAVHQNADVAVARQLMVQHNLPGILVDTGTDVPGFLTRRDFFKPSVTRRSYRKRHMKPCVRDIMSHPVKYIDASQPIELCAQMMQEQGIRRAAVRDLAAADPGNPLVAYIGLVSDATIFRYLGLYPEEGTALEEEERGTLGLPSAVRMSGMADSSVGGSAFNTPDSSRAATPLMQATQTQSSWQPPDDKQQQPQTNFSSAGVNGRSTVVTMGSGGSRGVAISLAVVAPEAEISADTPLSEVAFLGQTQLGSAGQCSSRSSASSTTDGQALQRRPARSSTGSPAAATTGGGAQGTAPDALLRYRTAASLWEVDVDEMEFLKKIGEGSFGEVMLASYRGTKVAVKRLHVLNVDDASFPVCSSVVADRGGSQAAFRQFFEREIAILASIRHPNVVNFIGACHKPGQRCLVTEYCARGSLDQVLHKSGVPLDLPKRVEFAMDIARGMACLHAQRPIIIHRDLKTANLLVSARFEVKVADFGLSRIKDASHLQVSRAGLEGTIEYCAPEVLRGDLFTERCDVYSFGVVLWELLRRQRPYSDHDVPVYLLMVNIGNGTLSLPGVPVDAATPGLCALVDSCLAFSAADRPDFRDILQALEVEYRALRATQLRQLPQQQRQDSPPPPQQPLPGAPRCDSASSLGLQALTAQVAGHTPDVGNTSTLQSPAGSTDGRFVVPFLTAAVAGNSVEAPQHCIDAYHLQQQLQPQPAILQYHQPTVQTSTLHRHRLSQADSLATSSGGSSVLPPPPAMGLPFNTVLEQQHSQQLVSVPFSQLLVPQQYMATASRPGSGCNSPRQRQQQQPARVLSAFGTANLYGTQQLQQQQQQAASGVGLGGSCSKPPRQRQQMSRARSLPIPQSVSWELEVHDEDEESDVTDGTTAGGVLLMEDSYGSDFSSAHALRGVSGYSPCPPNGQLCVVLEQAASAHSGMFPTGGQVYLAHPQQQQVLQAVPVMIAQPGCVQYQPYQQLTAMQQQTQSQHQQQQYWGLEPQNCNESGQPISQYAVASVQQPYLQQPFMVQQSSQPLLIPSAPPAPRMVLRNVYTPSPTPAGLATPPLSSSPSMNLNPLAVMAAAGAAAQAARREGADSGAASPNAAAALNRSGSFSLGLHSRRSSSQGGARCQVPPLPLVQMTEASSPTCLSAGAPQSPGGTECSTPVMGGAGAAGAVPQPLLQRFDSLHRSGSASPRTGVAMLHILPPPAMHSEHSGQLVGVFLAAPGSGPPSAAGSPLGTHLAPAGHHRHPSSRLAIQGSYELPPGAVMALAGSAIGLEQQQQPQQQQQHQQQVLCSAGGGSAPGLFLHQAAPHLQPSSRRHSLLRIDSNSKDRSSSPFAMVDSNAGPQNGGPAAASPFAAAAVQSSSCSTGSAALSPSPFAAAASNTTTSGFAADAETTSEPLHSSIAAIADAPQHAGHPTGAGGAAGKPSLLTVASSMTTSSSRLSSPFAAASYHSPFAAASADETPSEHAMSCDSNRDTGSVDDTTPRSNTRHSPTPATGDKCKAAACHTRGAEGAWRNGKPVVSPFALLQQAATDDTVDGAQI